MVFLKHVQGILKIVRPGRFSQRGTLLCLSGEDIKLSNFHQITHLLVHVNVPQVAELVSQPDGKRTANPLHFVEGSWASWELVLVREPCDNHARSLPPPLG